MKVDELRGLLKNASPEMLIKIVSELYRHVPKALKVSSDEGIDLKIKAILQGKTLGKLPPASKTCDFPVLKEEIDTFVSYANDGYYFVPNRIVPKSVRSKWRFAVMRQIKALKLISRSSDDYNDAVSCMIKLFKVLSRGCGEYLFSSEDPFASIGISQGDFYKMICDYVFVDNFSYDQVTLGDLIDCAATVSVDRVTIREDMVAVLVSHFSGNDPHIPEMIGLAESKMSEIGKRSGRGFELTSPVENLIFLIMGLYFRQEKFDRGYDFYWNMCAEYKLHSFGSNRGSEILFYCMMKYCRFFGISDEIWLKYFDLYRVKVNDNLRDSLIKDYNETKSRVAEKSK
jgi:hypothetical protein